LGHQAAKADRTVMEFEHLGIGDARGFKRASSSDYAAEIE
jgi:hypothetical protein